MRRRLVILLVGSVVGTMLASPARADDGDRVVAPPPAATVAANPLAQLREQLRPIIDETKIAGFAGMAVDAARNEVTLYWHGAAPALAAQLRSAPPAGSRLRIVPVPHSLAQLQTEAYRLAAAHRTGSTPVSQVGVLPDFSGLSVAVRPGVDIDAARRSVTSSVKLSFTTAPEAVPAAGRWDDFAPFWGGGAIASPDALCSTAFSVRDRFTGVLGMLTAYHCGFGVDWTTGSGRFPFGRTTEGIAGYDVAVITGQTYDNVIFTGDYTSTRGETVGFLFAPAIGDFVCLGGAFSGEVCRNRVTATFQYVNTPVGTLGPGFWSTQLDGLAAAGEGDSGGPAYVRGSHGIEASGVISAIDLRGQAPCLGIPLVRACSTTVFTVGLTFPFEDLGLQLLTS